MSQNKELHIIAGPNGAGKTTSAKSLLPEFLETNEFVNADKIAAGKSSMPDGMQSSSSSACMTS